MLEKKRRSFELRERNLPETRSDGKPIDRVSRRARTDRAGEQEPACNRPLAPHGVGVL